MRARGRTFAGAAALVAGVVTCAGVGHALDKQGAAHKGEAPATGFGLSGEVFLGVLPYNPTYAARPDNSGRALLRAGGHLDVDLLGPRLFIPLDLNVFTDRLHQPARPSELDFIGGVASTWDLPVGHAEVGARGEVDAPADGVGGSQFYGDVRGRYLLSLRELRPEAAAALAGGDVAGWLTLGWFALNPNYYARPDNTGRALLRYAAHVTVGLGSRLSIFVDGTFFTDRRQNPVRPSELDLTVGVAVALGDWGIQAAYERDMPVDGQGTGLVQHMAMLQGSWSFGWRPGP
jgi:hypothetical protein